MVLCFSWHILCRAATSSLRRIRLIDSCHDSCSIFSKESNLIEPCSLMSVIKRDFDSRKVKRICTLLCCFARRNCLHLLVFPSLYHCFLLTWVTYLSLNFQHSFLSIHYYCSYPWFVDRYFDQTWTTNNFSWVLFLPFLSWRFFLKILIGGHPYSPTENFCGIWEL